MGRSSKLSDEQKAEVIKRYKAGESINLLGEEFGVGIATLVKYIKEADEKKQPSISSAAIKDFAKRARQILWRQDHGREKRAYNRWDTLVKEFRKQGRLTYEEAIIEASRDFPCLNELFTAYKEKPRSKQPKDIECEGREQSHRENLAWAINAAGKNLSENEKPKTCPNWTAYYLYRQAIEEPKDFLAKYTQIEAKGSDELEEQRRARKSGKRSIEEINEMLAVISADDYSK